MNDDACYFCGDDRLRLHHYVKRWKERNRWHSKDVLACKECLDELIDGTITREPVHFFGGSGIPAEKHSELAYHGTGVVGLNHMIAEQEPMWRMPE